ncbi:hypothetical protein PHYBLDRAFT_141178 [Phycomyces blakesleeanus NRRL 1555(-)]|uniref:Uncharacterized protein n=1 Tax=Phycomyces blakesleeanus (strain ATCC 8743b / DSM 1359 / FGSC 10004 / NBRC 33097 / NRRL 1555) TaxID=763407 RepID=A0A162UR97_PHYB8|nr:hypothetical protein PHYBLDRAFT_141178 [Phycomyces blakesleeanus NRRL 1555(-)]OAD77293.1 hypothetical protein PHYBLDRAFT_141178 [Phycomyces blakesleeanus NRRL 1555(-)]|eukprot:XP_018295333.1 hypothetical protein PHYBLDRAFT_141178 [Phycomyces blakesleeanus NRRL 1555(-)]
MDPSPPGRRPDLTAKGKKELVARFPRKSGKESRGEVKQRCTSAYTIPSQQVLSRSTVSTPHRTQPQPTRLDTCAGNCQVARKAEARSSSAARQHTPFQANGCFQNNIFRTTLRITTTNPSGHLRRKLPVKYDNKDRPEKRNVSSPGNETPRESTLVKKSGVENRGEVKQHCTSACTIPSQRMFSRSTVSTPHRTQPQPTRLDTCAGNCQ